MVDSIFKQIDQYLLNQQRIHWNADKIIGYGYGDRLIGMAFVKFLQYGIDQFLKNRGGLEDVHCFSVDPGDRQKIFNNSDQVLGIFLHIMQQFELLIWFVGILIFDVCWSAYW